jgi:hypothetical protein
MRSRLLVLTTAALMMLAVGAVPASADGHNQRSCEAAGGTWTSTQGTKSCVTTTEEEGKNSKFECTTTSDEGGQGNLKNKSTYDESEGSTSPQPGSGKCPAGQFK